MGYCTECKPVPDGGLVEPTTDEMRQLYEQSLMLYRTLDDRRGTAAALEALGKLAHSVGAYDESNQLLEESLALRRALDDQDGVAASLTYLGRNSWIQGRLEEAERLLRDSLTIYRVLDDQPSIAVGLVCLGEVLCRRGEFAKGCSLIEEGLTIGNIPAFIWDLNLWLCEAKSHLGEYAQARAVGQRTLAGYRETPHARTWAIGFAHFVLGLVALAEDAYAEARRLLEESVTLLRGAQGPDNLAWALAVSAYAARGLGELPEAEQCLSEALRIYAETGVFFSPMYGLPAAALLLADRGQEERAVELYALASRYPFVANSRWFEDVAGRHLAAVAAALPSEVVAAAQERGQARDLDATVAELLEELGD
jgi:tetratricopeptide (TPR) repeat protein